MLQLPAEIRLMIFRWLFRSLTLFHGFDNKAKALNIVNSIQSVCRQFKVETENWLDFVTFHFRSTVNSIDFFSRIDHGKRCEICNARVKAFPLPLKALGCKTGYTTYRFNQALNMFPGLKLSVLTVEDCYHDPGVNDGFGDGGTACELTAILSTDGWKELHFISPTMEFLTSRSMRLLTARKVANQPGSWQPMNNGDRDGKSTAVYVSFVGRTFLDSQGSSENPDTREYSTKNSVSWRTLNDGSGENDENGKNKENVKDDDHDRKNALRWERAKKLWKVLVVAKRGTNAQYIQYGTHLAPKIEELLAYMSWEEIRKDESILCDGERDPCAFLRW